MLLILPQLLCVMLLQHLMPFVTSISSTAFDMLLSHLSSCAKVYRYSLESSERKTILLQLFKSCDYSRVGINSSYSISCLISYEYFRSSFAGVAMGTRVFIAMQLSGP